VTRRALIESTIQESLATKQRLLDDSITLDALEQLATRIQQQLATGRKVLLAGNGGSAADAQHIAAEFVGRFEIERDALAAIALTTDTSALTAIGNDYGFEHVFARQVSWPSRGHLYRDLNLRQFREYCACDGSRPF
jgi:D-sedoheptulose 7-phosphate isomerase